MLPAVIIFPIVISLLEFQYVIEAVDDHGILVPDYYRDSCPDAEKIVREQVVVAVHNNPRIAASLLRLHFHDCFVLGCDASVLLDSVEDIESEKEAGPNLNSLRGFEVIDKVKKLLEEACPKTVSCADILAIVARDAVELRGGPHWTLELGRRDSLKASLVGANQFIPNPNSSLAFLIANFRAQGLSLIDLVTLSGSHTIGRSRCLSFKQRLYHDEETDSPTYDHEVDHRDLKRSSMFRRILRSICPRSSTKRDNSLVPFDFMTSNKFDNAYYLNLLQGKGLLESDNVLISDHDHEEDSTGVGSEAAKLVWDYAYSQHRFFEEFAVSMVKMGRINPLTGEDGEIRRNCRFLNSWSPTPFN